MFKGKYKGNTDNSVLSLFQISPLNCSKKTDQVKGYFNFSQFFPSLFLSKISDKSSEFTKLWVKSWFATYDFSSQILQSYNARFPEYLEQHNFIFLNNCLYVKIVLGLSRNVAICNIVELFIVYIYIQVQVYITITTFDRYNNLAQQVSLYHSQGRVGLSEPVQLF